MDQRFIGLNYDNCDEDSDHDDDYGARDNSTIFNNTFFNQVLRMSNLDPEHRNDPLNDVFPKVKVFLKPDRFLEPSRKQDFTLSSNHSFWLGRLRGTAISSQHSLN